MSISGILNLLSLLYLMNHLIHSAFSKDSFLSCEVAVYATRLLFIWRHVYAVDSFFFFFSFIFINWRLIISQHCSGFCHTLTWISHGVACIPHPDCPSHLPPYPIPLGLHQPWALVSCIQPGLVICFTLDSILVSMPSVLMRWMKLEPIIQSEVSQKDKNITSY